MRLNVSATNFKGDQNFSRAYNMTYDIIELTLFIIYIMTSPFLLLNYIICNAQIGELIDMIAFHFTN